MARRQSVRVLLLITILLGGFMTRSAWAQGGAADDDEEPRVEKITFRGVEAAEERSLRASIATEETQCRVFLLQPFCWLSDSKLFVERHYLDREELERDVVRLRVYYFRHGYREASVAAEVLPLDEGVEVVFQIREGEPTIIDEIEVRQTRDVLSSRQIRRAGLPSEDEPLNLVDLELGMAYLEERLGAAGYLDAAVRDSVDVDRAERRARVEVVIDPDRRTTLESISVSGNDGVSDRTIVNALRFKRGRVLRINDIVAARRSLYESNLFHEVEVDVPEQQDSAKRVEVNVREAPPQIARIGGGFNTLEFFQVEGRYTHYNWLGGGRRLDARALLGNLLAAQLENLPLFHSVVPQDGFLDKSAFLKPTWQLNVGLLQPAFQSAENVVGLNVFIHRTIIPGIVVDAGYGAEISLTRRIDYGTPLSISYAYELASVEAGDLYFCVNFGLCDLPTITAMRGAHALSPITLVLNADRANDPLSPSAGYRLRSNAEYASDLTASDFRYARFSADGRYYLPMDLHRRRVLAGRLRLGWIRPFSGTAEAVGVVPVEQEEAVLHPRKRFYAGGSRSVRGFGENQVGPKILTVDPLVLMEADDGCTPDEIRSGSCDPHIASMEEFLPRPLGGTAVLEASIEYRFPFRWGMTGAVFLDGAVVGEGIAEAFTLQNLAVAPGFGVRLNSPIGPVRVDLGIQPGFTERLPVVTEYRDEAGVRHLVELETRRRYNPVEAAGGGFLQEIFSRVALHLSIGEAY